VAVRGGGDDRDHGHRREQPVREERQEQLEHVEADVAPELRVGHTERDVVAEQNPLVPLPAHTDPEDHREEQRNDGAHYTGAAVQQPVHPVSASSSGPAGRTRGARRFAMSKFTHTSAKNNAARRGTSNLPGYRDRCGLSAAKASE